MVAGEVSLPEKPLVVVITVREQETRFLNKKHCKQGGFALIENP